MFTFFYGASLKIARNLIKVTRLGESLAVFQKNDFSNIPAGEVWRLLLAMDACNLLQTMKEDFIAGEIPEEDLQDTVEDYVVENLKGQPLIPCRDGAERMEQCQEILKAAARFQEYWSREEMKDPGPRFYCVKELLGRLGSEANTPIHDNLFEFVYEQHNRFIRYFRLLLEPFQAGENPDPPLPGLAYHSPAPEPPPGPPGPLTEEGISPEALRENPFPLPAGAPGLVDLLLDSVEPFRGGNPLPLSAMADDLRHKEDPGGGDFRDPFPAPGTIPKGEALPGEAPEAGPNPAG